MVALPLLSLLLATTTLAAPPQRRGGNHGTCPVPVSAVSVPATLPPITSPPIFATMGVGVQNYTCTSFGNYSSIGAVAVLYDTSCLSGQPKFDTIQNDTFDLWSACPNQDPNDPAVAQELKQKYNIKPIIDHFFVEQNNTLSPFFNGRASGPANGAFVLAKKAGDIPSPDNHDNIDWLELLNVSGELAKVVYRIHTVKGQPAASCTPGSPNVSVKYTAQYVFVNQ